MRIHNAHCWVIVKITFVAHRSNYDKRNAYYVLNQVFVFLTLTIGLNFTPRFQIFDPAFKSRFGD